MKRIYRTQATAIGGRTGSAASADGRLRVRLDAPRSLGGGDGEGTNPEQLFAAGYAACFLSTLRRIAAAEGVTIAADSNVTATVSLEVGDGHPALGVALSIDLPGLEPDDALRLAEAAEAECAYARAVRGNVPVEIRVI